MNNMEKQLEKYSSCIVDIFPAGFLKLLRTGITRFQVTNIIQSYYLWRMLLTIEENHFSWRWY